MTMRKPKIKKNVKVKSPRKMIGIIQTTCCYIPQIRIWMDNRWIKTSSKCIMRKIKTKCLNRVWKRKNDSY